MNRREFTASLAALAAAPAVPLAATAAPATAAIPPGAYAWAQLIARAQAQCSPAMLVRHLGLDPAQSNALFAEMVRDNVLRVPGLAGSAQAVKPINATGRMHRPLSDKVTQRLRAALDDPDRIPTLAKDEPPGLGCADDPAEETSDARPDEPLQGRPRQG
ncbi:hypothetical protein [Sulfitobacter sp. JB4-11]|uniref:hypothetical protein n=1 Tax=Sulfitobacter rhodophyticola TaxID=3238304 RepID=UPI003517F079